ncbi:hypothetical protein [Leptospira brenneri]|uniref:Uncharacterized protein n=1 Tax=Leptospira brenneri TaxID=2023182 RepID=A0A2M9Y6Y4_9LEPT|nr:hypothetical protein [Leptospira brenneri]PJZ47317.1 hypothetical protein CH361_03025 [Leptospira brenneri]TGK95716.1 hypothetical protein EHQ30_03515 [Leptospira brenneri]
MKFQKIISIFLISTSILYAEESKPKPATFEYGLKVQNITYFPYETNTVDASQKSDLKNNKDLVYLPFFKYRNTNNKFGFDFDMTNIKISDPYYQVQSLFSRLIPYAYTYGNVQRQEYRLNFFYLPFDNQIFYLGLGLLKIDRLYNVENYDVATYIYSDKINSYGISVPLRSNIQFFDRFSLNLGFDPYVSYGRRSYVNQRTGYSYYMDDRFGPYFFTSRTNPNNVTEILGYQAEVSLSYQFYDNLKIYIGFSRNQSIIRSKNFDQTNFSYYGTRNLLLVSHGSSTERLIDTYNSIYFGVSNTH